MLLFYLLLFIGTAIIVWLGYKMWQQEKNVSIGFGIIILYYWSVAGGWFLVWDSFTGQSGRNIGLHYYYLFEKLFPVAADAYYFKSLVFYLAFIIIIELAFLYFRSGKKDFPEIPFVFKLNLWVFIIISVISCLISFYFIMESIKYAVENNVAIYNITRQAGNYYFTIHQLFNHIAVFSALFGYTALVMGNEKKNFEDKNSSGVLKWIYPIVIFMILSYMLLLGNKHELFFTGIFIILFFFTFSKKIILKRLILLIGIVAVPLLLNDFMRRYTPTQLKMVASGQNRELITDTSNVSIISYVVFSNELFSAHMSMYGVLKYNLEPKYGSSIISLVASLIPKMIWKDRPPEIYYYYSESLNLKTGQSYTINHATAWYLNFGFAGIVIGAIIIGFIWSFCFKIRKILKDSKSKFLNLLSILVVCSFTAFLPFLIRNGPEAYKALLFEGILIPVTLVFIASTMHPND